MKYKFIGDVKISGNLLLTPLNNQKALVTDATGKIVESTVTATELGYLSGATSNIQSQLGSKQNTSDKNQPNGYAGLDSSGKVASAQLPSYVDDVLEFADLASFPATGETGKIYVALDTNKCFRWSGSIYVEISPSEVVSVNGHVGIVSLSKSDVGLSNVDNTSDVNKPISTATQNALNNKEDSANKSTDGTFTADSDTLFPSQKAVKTYVDSVASIVSGDLVAQNELTKEPTGFPNTTDSTLSFNDTTRTFSISPAVTSFDVYIKGHKFTKSTAQTKVIPNTSGNHYFYFDITGTLQTTMVFSAGLITENAIVSVVYWNSETSKHTYFAEERHGLSMDGTTHAYLHTVLGARFISGLALQNFTIGNGSSNANAQFTSDSGSIRDEDILHTIVAQTQIPILFRQNQNWRKKTADAYPLIYSGTAGYTGANGRPAYNQYTGGAWQLTEMANTNFVLVHFFGTNDLDNPVVGVAGTQQYNNIPAARIGANSEISLLQDLPFAEFVPIGSVIFETNNYSNVPKARVVQTDLGQDYVDFRGTQVYTPAGEASDHGLLSGLSDDDHIQYHTDARGDARYYTKTQIDISLSAKEDSANKSTDGTLAANSDTLFPTQKAVKTYIDAHSFSSASDISEKSFSMSNNVSTATDVTQFLFNTASVRSFESLVSVAIVATSDLFETFKILGVQKSSGFEIAIESVGDDSGVAFSITSSGQIQYTSSNVAGFTSGKIQFRAITTSV